MSKERAPSMMSQFMTLYKNKISQMLVDNGFADVDPSYGSIIHALDQEGMMTMKALAWEIKRDKSTVTVLIRNLEKNKVVEKIDNDKDQRSKFIKLTEKGRDHAKRFNKISSQLNHSLWHNISDEEGDFLLEILDKLIENIQGEEDEK